jgi:hypothetical protein
MRRRQIEAERTKEEKRDENTYYMTNDGLYKTDGNVSSPANEIETQKKRGRGRPKAK